MPPDPASAWLKESQTAAFFTHFRTSDQPLECMLSNRVYSAIRKLANDDREEDDSFYNLDEAQVAKVILFRHLYGAPSCRGMQQAEDGLFKIGLTSPVSLAVQPVDGNFTCIKMRVPSRMLNDLETLRGNEEDLTTVLPLFSGKIIDTFIAGLREFPENAAHMKDKDFFKAVESRFKSKEIRTKLKCSEPLKLFIAREASILQGSGISRYQFFNDILTQHAYGFSWCERIVQSGLKTTFSPPQLVPVSRVVNLTREEWGDLEQEIEYSIPQQLENDLSNIAERVPPKPQKFSEYVRNTMTYYLMGHYYFAARKS